MFALVGFWSKRHIHIYDWRSSFKLKFKEVAIFHVPKFLEIPGNNLTETSTTTKMTTHMRQLYFFL
jgi:hypothetical protein